MKAKHTTKKADLSPEKIEELARQIQEDEDLQEQTKKGSVTPDPDSRPGWKLVKNNDNVGPKYSWVLDQPGSELRADEVCWTEGGDADCLIHPKPAAEHSNKGSGSQNAAEIRESGGKFHIYTSAGFYHCTCTTRDEAERIASERFPQEAAQ